MKKCIIRRYFSVGSAGTLCLTLCTCAVAAAVDRDPLVIKDQGSLIAGGTVSTQYFEGSQFPRGQAALEQFFRSMTPNTGPYDMEVVSDGVSALLDKIGPAILFTHSQGGGPGWLTAVKSHNVRAIVAFEPGSSFVFPDDEVPAPISSAFDTLQAHVVSKAQFESLTRIPIVIFYGDNIPTKPIRLPAQDSWRARLGMARLWRDTVNRHGGDVRLVHLPEIGIKGNSHFPFADRNNIEIADLVAKFLAEKDLDCTGTAAVIFGSWNSKEHSYEAHNLKDHPPGSNDRDVDK
jgi:hypothetical protein